MSIQTRTVLKSYFEQDDVPTEAEFIDLIDSLAHKTEDAILTLNGTKAQWSDGLILDAIPTSYPGVADEVWNSNGNLVIGANPAATILNEQVFAIAGFNMTFTPSIQISAGLDINKVRKITAVIFNDTYSNIYDYSTKSLGVGELEVTAAGDINIHATPGGFFDNPAFSNTLINRGFVTVNSTP